MRIIDGKRDYYDTAAAYGIDPTVVFVRTGSRRLADTEVYGGLGLPRALCGIAMQGDAEPRSRLSLHRHNELPEVNRRDVQHVPRAAFAVLAGTLYRGLHIKANGRYGMSREVDARWIWTASAMRAYARDHDLTIEDRKDGIVKNWESEWVTLPAGRSNVEIDVRRLGVDGWFEPEALTGAALEAVITERVTILTMNPLDLYMKDADGLRRHWCMDQPTLGAMEFAKAVPPAVAFQEIAMWRGGVLGNDATSAPDIVDDRIKIAKHGYDERSFRRDKTR